jgi:formylglycine-generating enzyme required for sulfatase activity
MKNIIILLILLFPILNTQAQNIKKPQMIFVQGGTFKMGSTKGYPDEKPIHKVSLSSFYISKYEITVAEYKAFCKATGYPFPAKPNREWYDEHDKVRDWIWRDNYPIVNVDWYDAMEYCKWLSKITGEKYDLPTEAQWEYAARGGKKTHGYEYSGSNNLKEVAWYDETTYERGPRPVGQLKPNELGIYDMSGNAFEWCRDHYGKYPSRSVKNPKGPSKGPYRVIRGGSWYYVDEFCRVTQRDCPKPGLKKFVYGFRVVKEIKK